MSDSYKDKIFEIAVNTFEVLCYMFPLEKWEVKKGQEKLPAAHGLHGAVSFSGAAKGEIIITPSANLLTAMAQNMLGIPNPNDEHKSGALCEIANIICGNVVPLFANSDNICSIQPPHIIASEKSLLQFTQEMNEESIRVYLDEGMVEIALYYKRQEEL